MTIIKLIIRSLAYYRRQNMLLAGAVAVTACLLTGALLVGDAMRGSLESLVDRRVGTVETAIHSPSGYFSNGLADSLAAAGFNSSAVIMAEGAVSSLTEAGGSLPVTVYGVDRSFFGFSSAGSEGPVPEGTNVLVNRTLAGYGFNPGNAVRLKVTPYEPFNTDSWYAQEEDQTVSFAMTVADVASDERLGRFSIRQQHYARPALFVERSFLARKMDVPGKTNIILTGSGSVDPVSVLNRGWSLPDAGIILEQVKGKPVFEIRSDRIFIPENTADATLKAVPGSYGVQSYFVNTIGSGKRGIPYSFISTVSPPASLDDDKIILNSWAARDLRVKAGDEISLTYFLEDDAGALKEESHTFILGGTLPLDKKTADPGLMPRFPGFDGALECRHWDPGLPVDLDRIRSVDEDYWSDWQGTPKGFISPAAARKIWPNRYGPFTAIRVPEDKASLKDIEVALRNIFSPAASGVEIRNLRDEGLASVKSGIDFGSLFASLSFFIIAAAVMLTVLLFRFMVEQRSGQTATLEAVGFTPAMIRRLLLGEGIVLAAAGAAAGIILSIGYQQLLLWALNRFWQDITAAFTARTYISPATLLIGFVSTVISVPVTQWFIIKRHAARAVSARQRRQQTDPAKILKRYRMFAALILMALFWIGVYLVKEPGMDVTMLFFVVGTLVMLLFLVILKLRLTADTGPAAGMTFGTGRLIRRYLGGNANRSVLIAGMLMVSTFIVLTIGLHHKATFTDDELKNHGTGSGGFNWIGTSTLEHTWGSLDPFQKVLEKMTDGFAGSENWLTGKLHDGDDASCLNITRARQPKVLGISTLSLAGRKANRFVKTVPGLESDSVWLSLTKSLSDDVYPAVADQSVIIWGMGKAVGDTLVYRNSRGREFKLVLVGGLENSLFQGHVIIAENIFREVFPDEAGSRFFLMDTYEINDSEAVQEVIERARDFGIFFGPVADRLQGFAEVQNTYLAIFFILGAFGLLLGTVGVGVVIVRAGAERTYDYALLSAAGFTPKRIAGLLRMEHILLLGAGAAGGGVAAAITAVPTAVSLQSDFSWPVFGLILAGLIVNGLFWIQAAVRLAIRPDLAAGLRDE